MEMGRGAVGAPIKLPSTVVVVGGGEVVALGVMGMKYLNKEVTKEMPGEFQNEKGKVDDEEAKIMFRLLESDDQRDKLLPLMIKQEIQKKKKKKEERERRKMEKEEKDKNL
ncbi:uncharacterized protein MONOS_16217 [Monocercomonoides exilis]|uniref:uncharacterized protein n=1 Tax=Monocercomonoides exilis TaxID=2049356 RepID=UPI003559C804|nr:hypothetical protein MONOS_16217 [Monocercomonoides exilis]|eukprot:MONOS_16217.1-p1 / transcript=MONOS_16217.1 / gene=MONOS_16217 / organism=Monocercomonoides_exilis_PA203 / gene_product=unspecified product / transcript_product=unspecified product / location=Mono_scaffold01570:4079-4411(-) / protein_length=111 / sequence_SO=supercontig / SO=protein_coding / is_pseudo=false